MQSVPFIRAVNNLEKLANRAIFEGLVSPDDITTIRLNLFVLKMMPQYTGIEGRPNVRNG